jgi:hypothetical protein
MKFVMLFLLFILFVTESHGVVFHHFDQLLLSLMDLFFFWVQSLLLFLHVDRVFLRLFSKMMMTLKKIVDHLLVSLFI